MNINCIYAAELWFNWSFFFLEYKSSEREKKKIDSNDPLECVFFYFGHGNNGREGVKMAKKKSWLLNMEKNMDNSTNLETNMHVRKGYMFVYVFDVCVCVFFLLFGLSITTIIIINNKFNRIYLSMLNVNER